MPFPIAVKFPDDKASVYTEGTQRHGEVLDLGWISEQWLKHFIYMEVPVQINIYAY